MTRPRSRSIYPNEPWCPGRDQDDRTLNVPESWCDLLNGVVMNHEDGGFDCPGCAWPDDPSGLRLDLCENGVKHTTWELTRKQVGGDFFAAHTVAELAGWSDYDLEAAGRLAEFRATKVGTTNVQVRIGGDMALLRGVAKAVFEAAATDPGVLDGEFLESYTHGLEEYRALCEATPWSELVRGSGVDEAAIRALADSYLNSGPSSRTTTSTWL